MALRNPDPHARSLTCANRSGTIRVLRFPIPESAMRIATRLIAPVFLALALLTSGLVASAAAAGQPNIVVILADDQGWGDLSIHGNTNLSTPKIDSLAKDGALFERFFVCAVCAPTRAEFLSGRY